jgi:hypothetical protein
VAKTCYHYPQGRRLHSPATDTRRFTRREDDSRNHAVHYEQALPTQQLANLAAVGTSATANVAFHQQHVKGDSETALYLIEVMLKCSCKELSK